MKQIVCFYHANCMDGYGAAWVVGKKFGFDNVEFIPSNYSDEFINVVVDNINLGKYYNKTIYIVDFSFKYSVLYKLSASAHEIFLYDHHVSAVRDFFGKELPNNAHVIFDMDECGTSLTWKQLFGDEPFPWFIKYIKDRDLWQWKLDDTGAFSAAAFNKISKPEDIEELLVDVSSETVANYLEYGRVVLDDQSIRAKRIIEEAYLIGFEGYQVPIANCPKELMSVVGHELCKTFGSEFSITYRDVDSKRYFSLRGLGRVDVSEIATKHGGGGHRDAAGFIKNHDIYKYLK